MIVQQLIETIEPSLLSSKEEIQAWLDDSHIEGKILPDGSVDVTSHIVLALCKDGELRAKLNISESIYANDMKLKGLYNFPERCRGVVMVDHNKLKSLVGSPVEVKGLFSCQSNPLVTLKGLPKKMLGIHCDDNVPLLYLAYSEIGDSRHVRGGHTITIYHKGTDQENDELSFIVRQVFEEYQTPGKTRALALQQALIDNKYRDYSYLAKL